MLKSRISMEEYKTLSLSLKRLLKDMSIYLGLYKLDGKNGFILTEKGKKFSDDSDYLHGLGRPYRT